MGLYFTMIEGNEGGIVPDKLEHLARAHSEVTHRVVMRSASQ